MYQIAHNFMQAHRMCVHLCERAREITAHMRSYYTERLISLFSSSYSSPEWIGQLMSNNFFDGIFFKCYFLTASFSAPDSIFDIA